MSDKTLSLRQVTNLPELVRGMSGEELALFCRALALMIFEQEVRDEKPVSLSGRGHAPALSQEPVQRVQTRRRTAMCFLPMGC